MQFLYHNVLFLMLIPIILLMVLIITNKDNFQKYFSKDIISKLSISNKNMTKTTRNILFFISLILMTIALARPVANEKEVEQKQKSFAIVVAIDVSKSMLATDIYPNRLEMAKRKLIDIIENSKENSIAVILFAKSSFILSPLTRDFNSLKILLNNLDRGINFDNGSNIYSTLESTNRLLKEYDNKNLILLTDGGNNENFDEEIDYAKKSNINVYTVALASKNAAPIKLDENKFLTDENGKIVTVSLNEKIKELSLKSDGGFINHTLSSSDIKQILNDIENKSTKKEINSQKFKTYTELFCYPLALAIFILLIATSSLPNLKKKEILGILFLFTIFFNDDLKAFEFDFKTIEKANEAYKNSQFEKASNSFEKVAKTPEAKYNYANALYKSGNYNEALKNYKDVVTSNKDLEFQKLHNMGNSYVKLNDLENAKKTYENALKIKEDVQTKENLEEVKKHLNRQKEKPNEEQNKKDNKNQQEKNQEQKQQEKKEDTKSKENNKEENSKENNANKNTKPKEISDFEEKKWLEKIENRNNQILLKKVQTEKEEKNSKPW